MRDNLKKYKVVILKLVIILVLTIIAVYSCEMKCNRNETNNSETISTSSATNENMETTVTGPAQVRVVVNEK